MPKNEEWQDEEDTWVVPVMGHGEGYMDNASRVVLFDSRDEPCVLEPLRRYIGFTNGKTHDPRC